jgi:site-specific DNA recombinase
LAVVICGCLSTIGVGYSTVLAQSLSAVLPGLTIASRKELGACQSFAEDSESHEEGNYRPIAASYARFSSDHQKDTSIEDQRRLARECAELNGYRLPPAMEYADYAVSGTKLQREGLDRLLEDAKAKRYQLLIVHSLSRLARESIIGMPILKILVCEYGIRFISVSESIDSDNPSWMMMATMYMLQHENYVKELGKNVHRGQEGTVLSGFAVGDHRFGYRTVASPNGEMIGRGRNAKPRMIYQIDPEEAEYVRWVFASFVGERRSISWITGELNRRNVPKDHRSTTARWHHTLVVGILTSRKYLGQWTWGLKSNKRMPSSGKVIQVARPESETDKWNREFPELRIVTDEVFFAAQEIRKKFVEQVGGKRNAKGRLSGRVAKRNCQHLLASLLKCKQCGSTFHTAGVGSKYMSCSGYKSRFCTCHTMVPRELAKRLILEAVGRMIKSNPVWVQRIVDLTRKANESAAKDEPNRRAQLEQELKAVEHRIKRLVDKAEDTDEPGIVARLNERRSEKDELSRQLQSLEREKMTAPPGSLPEWVQQKLDQLFEVMRTGTPAATESLHKLLDGPIILEEVVHKDRERCHFRGTLRIRVGRLIVDRGSNIPGLHSETAENGDHVEQITIDFRERTKTEEQAEIAWKMLNEQRPIKEIADVLQVSRARTTAILQFAAEERGEELIDGRQRRSTLPDSTRPPTLGDQKSEEIMRLYDAGVSLSGIAEKLRIDRNTVTGAISKWHGQRGLPVPDGRARRKDLAIKSSLPKPVEHNTNSSGEMI